MQFDQFRNTLPDESVEPTETDAPHTLHAGDEKGSPLSRREADVAGITPGARSVYGDDSVQPNREDSPDLEDAP